MVSEPSSIDQYLYGSYLELAQRTVFKKQKNIKNIFKGHCIEVLYYSFLYNDESVHEVSPETIFLVYSMFVYILFMFAFSGFNVLLMRFSFVCFFIRAEKDCSLKSNQVHQSIMFIIISTSWIVNVLN